MARPSSKVLAALSAAAETGDPLAALVARAREGDHEAFAELVASTHASVYTLAYRLVLSHEDAGDVVQEAYLRAFRSLGTFRGDARFLTWLNRITVNCAISHRRSRWRHRHGVIDEASSYIDVRAEHDPVAAAANGELRTELEAALARLPVKLRTVIVLRDVYGLTHEAIGQELGISESAAKVRLHRARRRLKADLFGEDGSHRALS